MSNLIGIAFRLNSKYPIYDENDNVIGKTSLDDIGIVSYHNIPSDENSDEEEYVHMTLQTGQYKGYDALRLDKGDFDKLVKIGSTV